MSKRLRNLSISIFVILWLTVFHYESLRFFYLNPFFKKDLPKVKLLFPPAGWIMFYNVDDQFVGAEVYGIKNGLPQRIDPHQIFLTRDIGYDNIQRNILSTVLSSEQKTPFCRFLKRRFPYFEDFAVTAVHYPSLTKTPLLRHQNIVYQCQ